MYKMLQTYLRRVKANVELVSDMKTWKNHKVKKDKL